MSLRTRLQRLERRAAALPAPRAEESLDDEWAAWCRGGCAGPWPPAGQRPVKYTPEEWQTHHRFFLALGCRSAGRCDLPEMTPEAYREVDETLAFFAAMDPSGRLSLCQQARLAPYRAVIARFLNDACGGTMLPASLRGESS
ncbi:MAG TPA: hypothetical protein VH575_34875 [Gemmataceae bacterium]|jgi:hypothetical protein